MQSKKEPERMATKHGDDAGGTPCMKVVVRLRPVNAKEQAWPQHREVIKAADEHMVVYDAHELASAAGAHGAPVHGRRFRDQRFMFDRVLDETTSQREVFDATAREVLDAVVEGFNATVFAYGATSSGKTHTMIGSRASGQEGLMVQSLQYLFERLGTPEADVTSELYVSYLEVYNETIRDLLVEHSAPLQILEGSHGVISVPGLSLHQPKCAQEVFDLIDLAHTRRTVSPTDANAVSSRSHAVLQVTVHRRTRRGMRETVQVGKLSLIDLAGSERAAMTSNRGARLREGANINQSLLALGNCITALSDRRARRFVPYRRSKLTRLLKDALGGNSRTVMIATLSPSLLVAEDSLNTLKYASQASSIRMTAKKTVLNVERHILEYKKIVADLRAEIEELRRKNLPAASSDGSDSAAASGDVSEAMWSTRIHEVAYERADLLGRIRTLRMRQSQLQRELTWLDLEEHADASKEQQEDPRKALVFAQVDGAEELNRLGTLLAASKSREARLEEHLLSAQGFSTWYRHACLQKLRAELRRVELEDAEAEHRAAAESAALASEQMRALTAVTHRALGQIPVTCAAEGELRREAREICRKMWHPRDDELVEAGKKAAETPSRGGKGGRRGVRSTPASSARPNRMPTVVAVSKDSQAPAPLDFSDTHEFPELPSSPASKAPMAKAAATVTSPKSVTQPSLSKNALPTASKSTGIGGPKQVKSDSPKSSPPKKVVQHEDVGTSPKKRPTSAAQSLRTKDSKKPAPQARRPVIVMPTPTAATTEQAAPISKLPTPSPAKEAALNATTVSENASPAVFNNGAAAPTQANNLSDSAYEERMKNVRAFLARSMTKSADPLAESESTATGRRTRSGKQYC